MKIAADFAHIALVERFEPAQKLRGARVPFVEREPSEANAVGQRVPNLVQGDVVFGSVDDMLGNACFFTACKIVPTVLGEKYIAIKHGAEACVEADVTEMNTDD